MDPLIDKLLKLAGYNTTDENFNIGDDVPKCPLDGAELEIHFHGGADCPQCGLEYEIGKNGVVMPSDNTIEEEAGKWPDTLPWGEAGENYYRTAMAERSGDPQLDALIQQFLQIENLSEHPDTTERYPHFPDPDPASLYANPEWAMGNCGHIANTFDHFLQKNGITPRDVGDMQAGSEMGYDIDPGSWSSTNQGGEGHTASIVDMPTGTYMIDWTARQYGEHFDFPHVTKLDEGGQWQPKFGAEADNEWTSSPEFSQFFTDATGGGYAPQTAPQWSFQNPEHQAFHDEFLNHTGNFDQHIESSIPDYRGLMTRKGVAITKAFGPEATVLDIMGGEGSWGKTVTAQGLNPTTSLDANNDMDKFFHEKSVVPGSRRINEAFGSEFTDHAGNTYPSHKTDTLYDVVNESMGFQFVSPDRLGQISQAKSMLKPGGLFMTDEKVITPNFKDNEQTKDEWKGQWYSPEQLAQKQEVVNVQGEPATGMMKNMATQEQLEQILHGLFQHVQLYWDQGNFVGYACSDDPGTVQKFLASYDSSDVPTPATQGTFSKVANVERFADDALRSLFDNGGFTLNADLSPITDINYVSSIHGAERQIPAHIVSKDDILSYRAEHADSLAAGLMFGGWLDAGMAYFDLSKNFTDMETAIEFGRQNNQLAIWDEQNKIEIPTSTWSELKPDMTGPIQ